MVAVKPRQKREPLDRIQTGRRAGEKAMQRGAATGHWRAKRRFYHRMWFRGVRGVASHFLQGLEFEFPKPPIETRRNGSSFTGASSKTGPTGYGKRMRRSCEPARRVGCETDCISEQQTFAIAEESTQPPGFSGTGVQKEPEKVTVHVLGQNIAT